MAEYQALPNADSCDNCGIAFKTVCELQSHRRATGHCFCEHCDRCYVDCQAFDQHKKSIHQQVDLAAQEAIDNLPSAVLKERENTTAEAQVPSTAPSIAPIPNLKHTAEPQDSSAAPTENLKHITNVANTSKQETVEQQQDEGEMATNGANGAIQVNGANGANGAQPTSEDDLHGNASGGEYTDPEVDVQSTTGHIECIASTECPARFSTAAALEHHLASGACVSGLTAAALDQAAREDGQVPAISAAHILQLLSILAAETADPPPTR